MNKAIITEMFENRKKRSLQNDLSIVRTLKLDSRKIILIKNSDQN